MPNAQRLSAKTCLITGAGQGIGEAIARAFVAEGATVLVTDIDDQKAARVADSLGQVHRRLDVASESDWEALLTDHPQMDVVVNNAGITGFEESTSPHDPENASLKDWHSVHRVNLDGVFLGCRYALKAMRAKAKGSIINISSRSGLVGIPRAAAYASSKAGVRNHTKSVALYAQEEGLDICCNSIHPAAILTPMWDPMLGDGDSREANMAAFVKDTPMRRFGTPDEIAALAVLLASDEARYMTGAELTVDGGLLAGSAASPNTTKKGS